MDPLDLFVVRFYFNGAFVREGQNMEYVGGSEEIAHVERRSLSLRTLILNLKVHYSVARQGVIMMLHWLYPGKEMVCGLKMVALDTDCKQIRDCVAVGSIAEIYVELYPNSEK